MTTKNDAEAEYRQRNRDGLRRALAEAELRRMRLSEINEAIAAIDARIEAAAAHHATVTEPLQTELAEIESQMTTAIAARETIDPALHARRAELLGQVAEANNVLELTLASEAKCKEPYRREYDECRMEVGRITSMQNDFYREPLAEPEMLAELFSAKKGVEWASARLSSAQSKRATQADYVALSERQRDHDNATTYRRRVANWDVEIKYAGEALAAANARIAEVQEQMRSM